jgi:hypothetical protein
MYRSWHRTKKGQHRQKYQVDASPVSGLPQAEVLLPEISLFHQARP